MGGERGEIGGAHSSVISINLLSEFCIITFMIKTISKTLLKLELKPYDNLNYVENLFNKTTNLVDLASSIINNIYPLRVKGKKVKDRWKYANSKELLDILKQYCKDSYCLTKDIRSDIKAGMLEEMHKNAEVSYHSRSLPKFSNLKDSIPIRIAKFTPSWSKESDKIQYKAYNRLGSFFMNDNKL